LNALVNACLPRPSGKNLPNSSTPDLEFRIRSVPGEAQILDGLATQVWRYEGELIKGAAENMQTIAGSYLGPILRAHKGQNVRIHYKNRIPQESIIHWHGMHVPESADGHPHMAIAEGESYTYDFTVMDRAGLYWYHPHPHGNTGEQVLRGLAGLFMVNDEEEEALGLPMGEYDIPLVIQDRYFSKDNQFKYYKNDVAVFGFLGDRYLVNGQSDFVLPVATRSYRLRLLNGSNARMYALRLSDDRPLQVIGTDGGLLDRPVKREFITLATAERRELWIDFSGYSVGDEVQLLDFDPTEPDNEQKIKTVATFRVDREEISTLALPGQLTPLSLHDEAQAINRHNPKIFELSMGMGMQWLINGKKFNMSVVDSSEEVKLGDLEIWEFINNSVHMSAMQHPMHIHGLQFQVIGRESTPEFRLENEAIHAGSVDEGWHDTVLVLPGERVRVLMKFEDFEGLYMYHCHILEHEDMGMMRNYRVSV
jgi:FtsP/CotA-like multicopper oxidase with cupredoxin domain